MGRKLRSEIPQRTCTFIPEWSYVPEFQKKDRELKERQKKDYDHRHGVRPQETLLPDESVWVHTQNQKDRVSTRSQTGVQIGHIPD